MAKRRTEQSDKSKMTFMMFQLEGDDSTLKEGFQTISKAIGRMNGQKVVYALPNTNQLDDEENIIEDAIDVLESEDASVTKPKARSKRNIKSPTIIDIDLSEGDKSLKDFLTELNPNGTNKRYLACAYWLKRYRDIEEVSMDHIHTCFRFMGWKTPADATQPLRDCKSKNSWFGKGTQKGFYKINHVGENAIMEIDQGGE